MDRLIYFGPDAEAPRLLGQRHSHAESPATAQTALRFPHRSDARPHHSGDPAYPVSTMYQGYRDRVDVNRAVSGITVISASITNSIASSAGFRPTWRNRRKDRWIVGAAYACVSCADESGKGSFAGQEHRAHQLRLRPLEQRESWGERLATAAESRRRHSRQRRRILRVSLEVRPVRIDRRFCAARSRDALSCFLLSALIPSR